MLEALSAAGAAGERVVRQVTTDGAWEDIAGAAATALDEVISEIRQQQQVQEVEQLQGEEEEEGAPAGAAEGGGTAGWWWEGKGGRGGGRGVVGVGWSGA